MQHRVLKGVWPECLIDQCKAEVDGITNWKEKGFGKRLSNKDFPPAIRAVIKKALSRDFIDEYVGEGLLIDREFHGAGVHSSLPGGYLRMHRDFNHVIGLGYRVANLLLYLNREKVGGDLLVGGDRIPPDANTMVILNPDDWHGHPEPCTGRRDSIALYYYMKDKPEGWTERLVTDYAWTTR